MTICDVTFVLFMVSWFVSRHILFVIVIVSAWFNAGETVNTAAEPAAGFLMTVSVVNGLVYMLIALEVCLTDCVALLYL